MLREGSFLLHCSGTASTSEILGTRDEANVHFMNLHQHYKATIKSAKHHCSVNTMLSWREHALTSRVCEIRQVSGLSFGQRSRWCY